MKMAVFWVVTLCSLVDDGGSKYLWNVGKLLPDYTALQPRTQPSSESYLQRPACCKYCKCLQPSFKEEDDMYIVCICMYF
jgi:hypothetical protein